MTDFLNSGDRMSEHLNVEPAQSQGQDEGSDENNAGVWTWLVDNTDDMTVEERIEQAELLGRDDIVEQLKSQPE